MRKLIPLLLWALWLSLSGCGGNSAGTSSQDGAEPTPTKTRADSIGMLVSTVKNSSRLYTSEYRVHKIITHDDELKLKGSVLGIKYDFDMPAGRRRIAIPIDATLKGYIDFGEFSADNVIYEGDKIELILPDPKVEITSTKVNHDEIESYVALLRTDFTDQELATYEAQGRDSIRAAIPTLKIGERTRASASRLIIPIIRQLGFPTDNIVITFRKDFNERQLTVVTD